jgi:hypothetical protein
MISVRDLLDALPHEPLKRLCDLRDLPARSDDDRRSRLARSYRGKAETFFEDLRKQDLLILLQGTVQIGDQQFEFKNMAQQDAEGLRNFCKSVFIDGKIPESSTPQKNRTPTKKSQAPFDLNRFDEDKFDTDEEYQDKVRNTEVGMVLELQATSMALQDCGEFFALAKPELVYKFFHWAEKNYPELEIDPEEAVKEVKTAVETGEIGIKLPPKDKPVSTKTASESGISLVSKLSTTWSAPYNIPRICKAFGLETPRERFSQKQFRSLVGVLGLSHIELKLEDQDKILTAEDPSPSINDRVRLRLGSSSASTPKSNAGTLALPSEILSRMFKNESEVEHFFVMPLLRLLGYTDNDFSTQHNVSLKQGVKRIFTKADIIIFDGDNRDSSNALVVVEAKGPTTTLDLEHAQQAIWYAHSLQVPYCLVTNSEELWIYQNYARCMRCKKDELPHRWLEIAQFLEKKATIQFKKEFLRRHEAP